MTLPQPNGLEKRVRILEDTVAAHRAYWELQRAMNDKIERKLETMDQKQDAILVNTTKTKGRLDSLGAAMGWSAGILAAVVAGVAIWLLTR